MRIEQNQKELDKKSQKNIKKDKREARSQNEVN